MLLFFAAAKTSAAVVQCRDAQGDILQQLQRDQSKAIRLVYIVGQDNKCAI
ncbi:MAG: hypothetical protein OJF48_002450 [Afipia sp.]|jgi:hypothetical protein|nr:MAG: hypothetical protein OJF48_002450 [Afipia sp.]